LAPFLELQLHVSVGQDVQAVVGQWRSQEGSKQLGFRVGQPIAKRRGRALDVDASGAGCDLLQETLGHPTR